MNDILAGTNGLRRVEVNVAGEIIRNLDEPIDPIPGNDVYLTIDTRLQAIAREALIDEIEFWNYYSGKVLSNNGVVIAMNPKPGKFWRWFRTQIIRTTGWSEQCRVIITSN